MSGEQQTTAAVGVDAIQFGVMLGKMDGLLSEMKELKRDMHDNYATRHELSAVSERVGVLEQAPEKEKSNKLAVGALILAGITGIGSIITAIRAFVV